MKLTVLINRKLPASSVIIKFPLKLLPAIDTDQDELQQACDC